MADHKFGGDWTEIKLSRLHKYLKAYRHIFTRNEKARYFKTWYVDAFAGTGLRTQASTHAEPAALFQDVYEDKEPRNTGTEVQKSHLACRSRSTIIFSSRNPKGVRASWKK
jgi:three-Cys-motif partner protein